MSFNTLAPLTEIRTLLTAAGVQQVHTGVPESLGFRVSAYVALAGQRIVDKAGRLLQRETHYFVGIGYRVKGAEATAEQDLAALLDAFITQFYAARATGLNGTAENCALDLSLADNPSYQVLAGQEIRVYPLIVTATQQQTV